MSDVLFHYICSILIAGVPCLFLILKIMLLIQLIRVTEAAVEWLRKNT